MRNYKRSEATEQMAVVAWCERNKDIYPELQLIFHVPNGGKRNAIEGAKFKRLGVKAGVPDLCLPVPKKDYHGLFIEMKYGKGRLSKEQSKWIEELSKQGYMCRVCNGAEEAVRVINEYLEII
jgi:hypothetical protein